MGVACGTANFSTVPDESLQKPMPSPVAIAVQSGAMATVINRAINDLGLKTGYLASCGSQLGCRISDFIDYFATIPELRVILCYIEGVPDPAHFLEAARRARASGKTIVAVKVGASETSRAAALAHTGSLAGSAEAFDAVAGSAGVIRFNSFEDAIEAVEFLARLPLPHGHRMAVMSNSGALRSLITEAAERSGATLAALSDATAASLGAALEQPKVSNPLDTIRTIPEKQYRACLDTLVDAPEVDIVLVAEDLPIDNSVDRRLGNLLSTEDIARRAESLGKTRRGVHAAAGQSDRLRPLGARKDPDTCRCCAAPSARCGSSMRWRMPAHARSTPARLPRRRPTRSSSDAGAPAPQRSIVQPRSTKSSRRRCWPRSAFRCRRNGSCAPPTKPLPPRRRSASPSCSRRCRRRCRTRAMPGSCASISPTPSAVRQAAATIAGRASSMGATLDGMLVAKQVSGGTEVVLGVQRDVEMGPVVMFGMGGVLVELFKDVSFAPATLDREQARAMVRGDPRRSDA